MSSESSPSSSGSDYSSNSPILQSQGLLKEPSKETCKFNDSKISALANRFPPRIVFRPFDPSALSDFVSTEWVCFPTFPFQIGFTYPFPEFTSDFFAITGLNYVQAMPMIWRTLLTIEEIINNRNIPFTVAELSFLYNMVTHGSNRFVLKNSIPDGAKKSSPKTHMFILDDVDDLWTSKSVKKEKTNAGPATKLINTRSKSIAHKRQKTTEPRDDFADVRKNLIDLDLLRTSHEKSTKELKAKMSDMMSIVAARDKVIARLEKDNKALAKDLQDEKARVLKEVQAAVDEAKEWAAKLVIQARIKMAKQVAAAGLDMPEWNLAKWEQTLANLDGNETQEEVAVDQEQKGKGEEVKEGAGGEAIVGDEGVMQA
ncbi:hypothetical protein QVD17_37748 [Tagetes erecta]|uniref:Uncharacterized protein n=1 Tax=Tagetes erecta TaxID=13708 RepID=A0AAD8JV83_TARER|nr:hypothetical protein QVD17_37748 [Tagetes erecta]